MIVVIYRRFLKKTKVKEEGEEGACTVEGGTERRWEEWISAEEGRDEG